MRTSKGASALVLSFSLLAGACATNQVRSAPDPALNRLDAACKATTMDYSGDARDCFDAAVAAENAYQEKVSGMAGGGTNVDYDLLGAVHGALESQECGSAHIALNNWAIDLGGAKGSMTNITRDRELFASMSRYFAEAGRCYEEYREAFAEAGARELEADARRRSIQATGIGRSVANKFSR